MSLPGFHDIESATYVYVSNELINNKRYGWYTLEDGESGQPNKIVISERAVTGLLDKLELKKVEVKAGKKTEEKEKLDIHLIIDDAGKSCRNIIRCGLGTTFCRGFLLKLNSLSSELYAFKPITIIATPALENEKVVFAGLKIGSESVRADWQTDVNFEEIITSINELLLVQRSTNKNNQVQPVQALAGEEEEIPS